MVFSIIRKAIAALITLFFALTTCCQEQDTDDDDGTDIYSDSDSDSDSDTDWNGANLTVQSIAFAFEGSNSISLKDNTRPDNDEPVPIPEFVDKERSGPVAYAHGANLSVKAVFRSDKTILSAKIGSSAFTYQKVEFEAGESGEYLFTADTPLEEDVGVHTLTIDWRVCDINDTGSPLCETPKDLSQTEHTLYVTHNNPAGKQPYFEKILDWSCTWTASATSDQEIVQACFDELWSLNNYYYVFPFTRRTGDKVDDVLDFKRGACSEWAAVLLRCIEVQGVDVYMVNMIPDKLNDTDYVKFRINETALGGTPGPWEFGNHVVVLFGSDFNEAYDSTVGTAYDLTYHLTGPGWGGYEDTVIEELGDDLDNWYPNPGFGGDTSDDVLNTKLYSSMTIDDWDFQDDGKQSIPIDYLVN